MRIYCPMDLLGDSIMLEFAFEFDSESVLESEDLEFDGVLVQSMSGLNYSLSKIKVHQTNLDLPKNRVEFKDFVVESVEPLWVY